MANRNKIIKASLLYLNSTQIIMNNFRINLLT